MFDNRACYASAGIGFMLDSGTQNLLCLMIDGMEVAAKDYLQVFELSAGVNGGHKVIHRQEEPPYRKEYLLPSATAITAKVYAIDDGQRVTMLLADEY